jgi:hypothetical protein
LIHIIGGKQGLKWAGGGTGFFLNPEYLNVFNFIKFPTIYILKNLLCDSIKGGKKWLNLDQFR